jgi:thioredoxin
MENDMETGKLKTLTEGTFDEEIRAGLVLVDFWAEWCGPCRALAPTVDALAAEFDGRLTVAKLNIDENAGVPNRFQIRSIPTLLLLKDGQVEETIVGLANRRDIAKLIEKHL